MDIKKWLINNISLHNKESKEEELVNGLTHILGSILGVIGLILLIIKTKGTPMLGPVTVYGLSIILLFTASGVYHLLTDDILKRIGRILDHSNIYLLIAGTYTPIAFYVGGRAGVGIVIVEWALTLIGIIFTIKFWGRLKPLHVVFYLIMGWMIVFIWKDFITSVPAVFPYYIVAGGIIYTLGVVVYGTKAFKFYHGVWHLFVLAGAISMYLGIYKFLV